MSEQTQETTPPPPPTDGGFTTRVVGIRFKSSGKVYDFDATDLKLKRGDQVLCDWEDKGTYLGTVSKAPILIEGAGLKLKLRPVARLANFKDVETKARNDVSEKEYLQLARSLAEKYRLPMHLICVEMPINTRKLIIYFSAEDRVDFRDMIKEMINQLKMRVELRQLGARDETKFIGGLGPCGQETCCSRFLTKFAPVSIKMAKDQGLSLNPTKVTGNCGRLKCCLAYEQPVYVEARKTLPKLGNCVKCSSGGDGKGSGCGIVTKLDVLAQKVGVKFDDGTFEIVPLGRILEMDTLQPPKKVESVIRDEDILEETEIPPETETTKVIIVDEN